jgi:hypothetical protein
MGTITTNVRGTITALATPEASADMLVAWREVVVKAARRIDQRIIDLEKNETWEKVKMHGISFDQYAVKKSGGLEKLRQEIQAENEGVVVPMAINWLGRTADIKEKRKSGEKQATSVVFSIKGKKIAQRCLEKGLRAAGVWHEVERYIHAGPDTFCESCCGWAHHDSKCGRLGLGVVKCMLCAGKHKTEDHQCDVVGCKAKKGQNCTHNNDKCANCRGNHIAKSNACPNKQEAIQKDKEERISWRERVRGRNIVRSQEKPENETEALATEEAEKEVRESQSLDKEEIQVPATQQGSRESISETQW